MNRATRLLALCYLIALAPNGAAADPVSRADAIASTSSLSRSLPDWREVSLALSHRFDDGWAGVARLDIQERFDKEDVYAELRIERALRGGTFYFAAGGAEDADFRPELAIKAGGQLDISERTGTTLLLLDADASRFNSSDVFALKAGIDHQLTANGWRVRLQAISVSETGGPSLLGYALQSQLPLGQSLSMHFGYADAPETSEGVVVRVKGWTTGLILDVGETWIIRADVTTEDRGAYTRDEIAVGTALRF